MNLIKNIFEFSNLKLLEIQADFPHLLTNRTDKVSVSLRTELNQYRLILFNIKTDFILKAPLFQLDC